jgi:AhpC/TSA family
VSLVLSILSLIVSPMSFSYQDAADFLKNTADVKALVFLSKDCPCSKSHVEHLNQLHRDYKTIPIYGVIADPENVSEAKESEAYFSSNNFQFPLIKDREQILVKQFKALKTPHVALLKKQPNGEYSMIYEGGLTDQRDGAQAKIFFLKENLQALSINKTPPHSHAKSLGCYIRRMR